MPHIRIRSLTEDHVRKLSQTLPKELSLIMQTSEDNFTTEKVQTTFYRHGEIVRDGHGDPMVEVHWFDRGEVVKHLAAAKITELVKSCTHADYIAVIFFDLPKENYFENGQHF